MTIEKNLIEYLQNRDFVFEGNIEDYMRANYGTKGGTVGRVLRFMCADKVVERTYQDTGHGKPNVKYRLNRDVAQQSIWKN